ncbi:MAG TPA: phosphate starvation-inducible protein PhoH, partial [Dokdonella sp.]|nr:phosphate starvation-inducible protein PhoH [Dokdonella sp.]
MTDPIRNDFTLDPDDGERLSNLVGPFDEHLRQIEM